MPANEKYQPAAETMDTEIIRNSQEVTQTEGQKVVHIIGPSMLQCRLFSSFLKKEMPEATCNVGEESIDALNGYGEMKDGERSLLLFDCQKKGVQASLLELTRKGISLRGNSLVCFFNAGRGGGIEEEALMKGVRGFFYEEDPLEQVLRGIRAVFRGELWFSRKVMSRCLQRARKNHKPLKERRKSSLTRREVEVLNHLASGRTNRKIADKMYLSQATVKSHLYNIFRKLGVSNRLEASRWASENL
jgi:LuxR family transcriptional regulator of csgAB operon